MSNDPNTYAILTTGCRTLQFKNVRSALVVCPKGHWLQRLDALATQYGLPSHTIEGLPDKNHPDTDRSYLFIDLASENVRDVINWAKLGGFKHVMPYHWTWAQSGGSYDIHCGNYGGTLCKLKEVSVNLQTNDLSLGLHTKVLLIGCADRKFTQYDGNHQLLSSGSLPPFKMPVILAGKNTLRYEHTGKNAALVRIVMEDNPIFT